MTDYIKHINQRDVARGKHDFGITDKKGRALGVNTYLREYDVVPDPKGEKRGYGYVLGGGLTRCGHWYEAHTHGTRDGETFGPLTRGLLTQDKAEAERWLVRRIEVARKRSQKLSNA